MRKIPSIDKDAWPYIKRLLGIFLILSYLLLIAWQVQARIFRMPNQKPIHGSQVDLLNDLTPDWCWLMNENTGNLVYNSGREQGKNNGIMSNARWAGGGILFDETEEDNDIICGLINMAGWQGVSVIAGIRWIQTGQGAEYTIIENYDANDASILFRVEPTGDWLEAYVIVGGVGKTTNSAADSVPESGAPCNVAMVANTTDIRAYVNGSLSGTPGATGGPLDVDNSPETISIGDRSADNYHGYIDYIYLYKHALTAREIKLLHEDPYRFITKPQNMALRWFGSGVAPPAAAPTIPAKVINISITWVDDYIYAGDLMYG